MWREQSFLTMVHAFSRVSHALSLCNRPFFIHPPASNDICRLWDPHLTEEDQREDGSVRKVKFSENGSFLAVRRPTTLEMWMVSTWERLWSVPCRGGTIDFSADGLQVLVEDGEGGEYNVKIVHWYDVRSGDALGENNSMPESMHDHVHIFRGEVGKKWECAKCKSSLFERGEYWFTISDRWLWSWKNMPQSAWSTFLQSTPLKISKSRQLTWQ